MKIKRFFMISICLLLITGCWDQNLMKDATLIQTITFDQTDEGEFLLGFAIPNIYRNSMDSGQETEAINSENLSTVANTPREGRMKLNTEIPGNLDSSKNKLVLFGEQFAKGDIYPSLDVIWRDPRSSLSAKLAVVKGKAFDTLSIQPRVESNISQNILYLIRSTETNTIIPDESIQTLASEILDPGEDIVLPLLKIGRNGTTIDVAGVALFDERKLSGTLSQEESTLFLLLNNKQSKYTRFTTYVNGNKELNMNNFISLNVDHIKRKLNVSVNDRGEVFVNLNLHLKVIVEEYPIGNVPNKVDQLNNKLSNTFTNNAEEVIKKLQEANCDAFGIGRRLIAFHHDTWKEKDKTNYFKDVKFKSKVDVEIIQHGIVK
ncbi:Ger(x)C family spore germination protein [Peribacillus simplex]|uniref:Germination protein, Ger(X)C family n=2 Tax=Bacillaceae TaxID=186817 RepID=A0AAN2PLB7_9BACI|nr:MULTISPECIES: Ger(x)C family spore germination protein [Peribacillus]MCP1094710.1 Ger(x)C family spore germination protein [Bacillaceae bacterium OS4b]MBD8591455.1 Ger(x)C family spore germination protein [Peribacillus simplex]MEA3577258.1 Ger(x)C family spore germination protein [Peribacillus frigoritolerans]MEB2628300.1 Ger(x)C family spore germination protein [Peribacillus frigoritolerans]NCT36587.1 Ger(x)C family spore germination protein [Peribacillus frigoritolerans]